MKIIFRLLLCVFIFSGCQKSVDKLPDPPPPPPPPVLPFNETPVSVAITPGAINEASGIADSKTNLGSLWVEQDKGHPADLYLLSYTGAVQKQVHIKGAQNRDWEDLAIGAGPIAGKDYIYIAETGDNSQQYTDYTIYRFEEPLASADTVFNFDKISFQYPDGSHDAEAIFTDNATKDIYIVTKRDAKSKIYKLPYPQSTSAVNMANATGELSFTGATGAAISTDGTEILIKTYLNVFYWKRQAGETIEVLLQKPPLTLGYIPEPQGEAICFKKDNSSFFTLSEKPSLVPSVSLNEYMRK